MNPPHGWAAVCSSLLLLASACQSAVAELPTLDEPPWVGSFAGYSNKRCQFAVSTRGKITLQVLNDKAQPMAQTLAIPIEILVDEILPDGKTAVKSLQAESLESSQPATAPFEKTVIRGKVTGGASFELNLEQTHGTIAMGGRILDPGPNPKNPLRFSIRMKVPSLYPRDPKPAKRFQTAFLKKIGDDHLRLTWSDGKRKKQPFDKDVDASSKDLNGPGITAAELECEAYKGRKLQLAATTNSTLALSNTAAAPLHLGFFIIWRADPVKDPEAKARFTFTVK